MLLLRRLSALALRLGLAALVVVALLISAARLALPFAEGYRNVLENTLSQRLGSRVSLGTLTVRLAGWEPRLILGQVLLSDPRTGADVLSLKAMELDLDVLNSLRMASPQLRRLTLVGAHLRLERSREGRWHLVGAEALKRDHPRALELFLGQGRLNLTESEILFVEAGSGNSLCLTNTSLQLRNDGWSHRLSLSARPIAVAPTADRVTALEPCSSDHHSNASQLQVSAALTGPPADVRSWNGQLAASLAGTDLGRLVPADLLNGQTLASGSALLESWHRIREGRLEQSLLRVDVVGLTLKPGAGSSEFAQTETTRRPATVQHLQALARVRPRASGWRIEMADLNASLGDAEVSGLDLDLLMSGEGAISRLRLAANQLDLAAAVEILRASPWRLPESLTRLLDARPRGQVTDLAFLAQGLPPNPRSRPLRWTVSAMLSDLGFARTPAVPGITGLRARLSADQDGGALRIGSEGSSLDLSPLFSERLALDQFSGQLDWRRDPANGWEVSGRDLRLKNADLAGQVSFGLAFPVDGGRPFLDLRARFQDANAAHTRTYLPVGVMQPDLVDWLTQSIVSGRVTQGDLIFRGALADYPFRQHQGRFELLLEFEDLLLDYQKGWPPIASAAGNLRFLNQGLDIRVERGRIYDSAFTGGEARIPDLWEPARILIHGEAEGPFSDGLRTLAETPLAKDLGRLAEVMSVSGDSRLALDIDLPLVKQGHLGVAGRLTWPDARDSRH